ncbi:MAG: hypothetical protein JO001_26235 [Alphaproteobacteria bacterium]|nr:hypothetical protein [Alphaproteobacteria bacterium]
MEDQQQKPRDTDKSTERPRPQKAAGERDTGSDRDTAVAEAVTDTINEAKNQAANALGETKNQASTIVRNVSDQAWAAANSASETAQNLARQARDQVGDVLGGPTSRAGEYISRSVNEYPVTALIVAGAIGYGIAFLMHNSWQSSEPSRPQGRGSSSDRSDRR